MNLCPKCGAYWECDCGKLSQIVGPSEPFPIDADTVIQSGMADRWGAALTIEQVRDPQVQVSKVTVTTLPNSDVSVSYDTYTGDWIH